MTTIALSGKRRIRIDGTGTVLHWHITPTTDRETYTLTVWDETRPTLRGEYVGPLSEMRRIAWSQGAR